jgi:hypothetical protein
MTWQLHDRYRPEKLTSSRASSQGDSHRQRCCHSPVSSWTADLQSGISDSYGGIHTNPKIAQRLASKSGHGGFSGSWHHEPTQLARYPNPRLLPPRRTYTIKSSRKAARGDRVNECLSVTMIVSGVRA